MGSGVRRATELKTESTFIQILCFSMYVQDFCKTSDSNACNSRKVARDRDLDLWSRSACRRRKALGLVLESRHVATIADVTYLRAREARRYHYWIH